MDMDVLGSTLPSQILKIALFPQKRRKKHRHSRVRLEDPLSSLSKDPKLLCFSGQYPILRVHRPGSNRRVPRQVGRPCRQLLAFPTNLQQQRRRRCSGHFPSLQASSSNIWYDPQAAFNSDPLRSVLGLRHERSGGC